MGHSLALYHFRLPPRGKPDEETKFGDISPDPLKVFQSALASFNAEPDDEDREAKFLRFVPASPGDRRVAAVLVHGQRGVYSHLRRKNGDDVARDRADVEEVAVMVHVHVPKGRHAGVLALHIPWGRGIKTLLTDHLEVEFHNKYPDRILRVEPIVPAGVLKEAVANNRVKTVRLTAHRQVADAFGDVAGWAATDEVGALELQIRAKKGAALGGQNLERWLNNKTRTEDLVRFEGLTFGTVKVQVAMPNGRRRTVTLDKQDQGHPLTLDLDGMPQLYLDTERDGVLTKQQMQADRRAVVEIETVVEDTGNG